MEKTIAQVTQQPVVVWGAGRTDAGVHASGQVVAFECVWKHPTDNLWRAINVNLPKDIALLRLEVAAPGFHPRYDAISRRYIYQFYTAPVRHPLLERTSWQISYQLDLMAMQSAANLLIGTHDFATFGQPTQGEVTIRDMYEARFRTVETDLYQFIIEGNAFLKHMVRGIMGTLVEVGRGKMRVSEFAEAMAAADRRRAGTNAPPHGLTLVQVNYSEKKERHENQELDTQS